MGGVGLILGLTLFFAVSLAACGNGASSHWDIELQSGRHFKLMSLKPIVLKTGEPAKMIRFKAGSPLDDHGALRAEALAILEG